MKKIKFIAAVIALASALTALFGCSEFESYWDVSPVTYDGGTKGELYVQMTLTAAEKYEVWVNVSSLEEESTIEFVAGYGADSLYNSKTSVKIDEALLKATQGWVRLAKEVSSSYSTIDVGTKYAMHINEIIACDENGNFYKLKFSLAGKRISRDSDSNRRIFTEEQLAEMKNAPMNACDEQNGFEYATIKAAFEGAASASDSNSNS